MRNSEPNEKGSVRTPPERIARPALLRSLVEHHYAVDDRGRPAATGGLSRKRTVLGSYFCRAVSEQASDAIACRLID